MSDITFTILKIVVSVCAALLTVYAIPYMRSQMEGEWSAALLDIIDVAVRAAEQTIEGGKVKKEWVVAFVTNWLNQNGIKITEDQLDKLIEAAVYSMNVENGKIKTFKKNIE